MAQQSGAYDSLEPTDLQQRLPLEDDAVDAVVCVGVMTYLPEVETVWREFARVARPGGLVVATQREDLWDSRNCQAVVDRLRDEGVVDAAGDHGPGPVPAGRLRRDAGGRLLLPDRAGRLTRSPTRSSIVSDQRWTWSSRAAKAGLTWAVPVYQRSNATCRSAMKSSRWVTSMSRWRSIAGQQRIPVRRVARLVPQLPQGDGELVEPGTGAAVVEVDQLDVPALEDRVAEMEVGVDEPVGVESWHHVGHAGGHRPEASPAPRPAGAPSTRRPVSRRTP